MIFLIIVKDDNNEEGAMSMKIHCYDYAGKETLLPEGIVMGPSCQ
jgi:hypothetical protein